MKNKILLAVFFFLLLFTGCFEDEGNYDYVEVNPPTWLFDVEMAHISVVARDGEQAFFKGSDKFVFEKDSVGRQAEVRYEWVLNGVVLSDQLDFRMNTREIMEKGGIEEIPANVVFGSFNIIEKKTGITYKARVAMFFDPEFAVRDWFVMSEDGNNTKLSAMIQRSKEVNGKSVIYYELRNDCYKEKNGSSISGKPISLCIARARNVGAMGSATVITDEVAYEVNCDNMLKVGELKDQFIDGTPPDFKVVARREIDPKSLGYPACSFVATEKGEIFTRQKSTNYLGGEFLTEPYYIDSKGYKITKFGHNIYSNNIPCYDELNRRVVLATVIETRFGQDPNMKYVYKTKLVPLETHGKGGLPFWEMPEGTKMLHISQSNHLTWLPNGSTAYTMFYNDASGRTIMGDFVVNYIYMKSVYDMDAAYRWNVLSNKLNEESVILVAANGRKDVPAVFRDFYSIGDEIYFIQRQSSWLQYDFKEVPFMKLDSKVTYMGYETYDTNNTIIVIGCENGDILAYDITNIKQPVEVFKENVGGKVLGIKQLGGTMGSSFVDYY